VPGSTMNVVHDAGEPPVAQSSLLATSMSAVTEEPVYTASSVSKPLPASVTCHQESHTGPLMQAYSTSHIENFGSAAKPLKEQRMLTLPSPMLRPQVP
jgi:hypothetical protein